MDMVTYWAVYSCKKRLILESRQLSWYTLSKDSTPTLIDTVKLPNYLSASQKVIVPESSTMLNKYIIE